MVVNAASLAKDRARVLAHLGSDAAFEDRWLGSALVAIQSPRAAEILASRAEADVRGLPSFAVTHGNVAGAPATIARTGYTGEDGFEVFVSNDAATRIWDALLAAGSEAGIVPGGRCARGTLPLEARYSPFRHEIDQTTDTDEGRLRRKRT